MSLTKGLASKYKLMQVDHVGVSKLPSKKILDTRIMKNNLV